MEPMASSNPSALGVTCPRCGKWFRSAMQMDPATFEQIQLRGMLERCGHCHESSRFEKSDYSFDPLVS